ncbi:MAG: hypothetical protein U9R38_03090 [Candidatus Margulisiibacteriota bacterium]|nr:hypothetical protein [Candidatus Margulisiibacteriota bacterium]
MRKFIGLFLILGFIATLAVAQGFQQIPASESAKRGMVMQEAGKSYIYAYATAAATALTPYKLDWGSSLNPRVVALADGATRDMIAIPESAVAVSTWGWFQIKGDIDSVVVPSGSWVVERGVGIEDGVVSMEAAAPSGLDTEFGVITATNSATSVDLYLFGRECLGST